MLSRRKVVIEDNQVSLMFVNQVGQLLDFAFSRECRRVRSLPAAFEQGNDLNARAVGQAHNFLDTLGVIGIPEIETDDNSTLTGARSIKHQGENLATGVQA